MSQATPRKFSEKIAILERKQNEEQEQFNSVMRDVRTITSTPGQEPAPPQQHQQRQQAPGSQQPSPQQYTAPHSNDSSSKLSPEGPHPMTTNWNRAGGSLPNVHQMVQQPMVSGVPYGANWSPSWSNVPAATNSQQVQHVRTRSPGAPHFHPYRNGVAQSVVIGRNEQQQRMSQGDPRAAAAAGTMIAGGVHLQPPDPSWSNRARSDPAIHTNAMMTAMDPSGFMSAYPFYAGPTGNWPPPNSSNDPKMFNGPATAPSTAQIQMNSPPVFFPTYPLPQQQQNNNNLQQQLAGQQMFLPAQPPQQLGSPSSSMSAQQQQQQQQTASAANATFLMGDYSASCSMPGMNQMTQLGMAMSHQQHQQQQQHNQNQQINSQQMNNFAMANAQQHQQMMVAANNSNCNSNRGYPSPQQQQQNHQQQQSQQQQMQQHQQQQQQQQHFNSQSAKFMMAAGPSGNNNNNISGASVIQPPPMYMAGPPMKMGQQQHQQQLATPANLSSSQSQSAPTSPAEHFVVENTLGKQQLLQQQQQQWPPHRHFSASPDGLEVPNICVTGTDGSLDIDCFQDLQDLHLDNETLQMLKDPAANEQVDPACETQLLS